MKKIILSLFVLMTMLGVSFANKTITLVPGWNVVSTPKLLSGINFSNSGAGISFYTLSGSSWISIIPTIQSIKPLEGFVVNNGTTGNVTMSLIYKTNVSPMEALFQRTLNLGWNIVGITTINNPFVNIGSNAVMSIDFTKSLSSNLLNGVNGSFTVNNLSSALSNPELLEAYGIFVTSAGTIYGGNQDITNNGTSIQFNQPNISYTKDISPGLSAVVFYTGTITTLEAITIQNPMLNFYSATLSGTDTLRTIYFKIGNTIMSANPPVGLTGLVQFEGTITIDGTTPVLVYADIKDTALVGSVKFSDNINLNTFSGPNEYDSDGQLISNSSGSLFPITNNIGGASLQMTNTYINSQDVQTGDRNLKLADLNFSTSGDTVLKIQSFKATLSGTNRYNFQGGTVTAYDADGNALVSNTITSGTNTLSFVLPNTVSVSKNNPVVFTLKLDQVANTVATSDALRLLFLTGDVVAKNYITNNSIYPSAAATSSTITVVANGTVTAVVQNFTPKLVKLDGSAIKLGSLQFSPYNGDAVLKNIYVALSGYSATVQPFSEITLKDGTTTVATFVNENNNLLSATNINKTLTAGATKTYDIVATLKGATTAADLGTNFDLRLTTGSFETLNGAAFQATTLPQTVSALTTLVKAQPIISYVSSSKGTKAYYKFQVVASGGDIKIDQLKLAINLMADAANDSGKLYLGNENGTTLGTVGFSSGSAATLAFPGLSGQVTITKDASQLFTLEIPVSYRYKGTNPGYLSVELSDVDYYDVFTDATVAAHAGMFTSFKWDIAPVTTLVTIQ